MAIVVKPNQAFAVSPSDNCGCGGVYCQPIANGDTYTIQGYSSIDTGTTILYDGLFTDKYGWTLDSGWAVGGGKMYGNVANNGATSRAIGMIPNEWYLVYANIGTIHAELLANKTISAAAFSQTFTISGGNYSSYFGAGETFKVVGSDSNDGTYTVVSVSYLVQTFVTVAETLVDETATTEVSFLTDYENDTGNNIYYDIEINGDGLLPLDGANTSNASNKYYWFYRPSAITTDAITITKASGVQGTIQVNEIQVYKVSTLGFSYYIDGILVSNDDNYGYLDYYYDDVYYSSQSDSLEQPILNWEIDILGADFDLGICPQICLYDSQWTLSDAVNNPNFTTDLSFWTAGTGWSWNSGAQVSNAHPGSLTQSVILEGGAVYNLEFSLFPNGLLFYYTVNGVATPESSYTGVVQQTIDLTDYTGNVTVNLVFTGVANVATIILYCRIFGVYDRRNCFNCITVQDTDAGCTLKFTATNNDNAFGFDYSHGLTHELRLEAKMVVSGFPEEKEDYLFSDNSRKLLFARRDTEYEISITDAPDYIHECLSMMRLNDTFTINGVEYIADGTYDLRKRKTSDLKQAVFTVKKKQGIASNYSCS